MFMRGSSDTKLDYLVSIATSSLTLYTQTQDFNGRCSEPPVPPYKVEWRHNRHTTIDNLHSFRLSQNNKESISVYIKQP
jgi:hypothetical protein